jgi:hypothetical protein
MGLAQIPSISAITVNEYGFDTFFVLGRHGVRGCLVALWYLNAELSLDIFLQFEGTVAVVLHWADFFI